MDAPKNLKVSLLLLASDSPVESGSESQLVEYRDSPYFLELETQFETIVEQEFSVEGSSVHARTEVIDGRVWACEARFSLADALTIEASQRKRRIVDQIRERLLPESGNGNRIVEEYSVVLVDSVERSPDEFVEQNSNALVRLLRTVEKPLDRARASEILRRRARYSQEDLTVVDWEGAIVIAPREDFDSEIELFKVGNYQLLGYRMMDRQIDMALDGLRARARRPRRKLLISSPQISPPEIVEQRLAMLLDFDRIDHSLLLIGDWYSSEVYRLIVDAFYLRAWKERVREKLDYLANVEETVNNRIALTWNRLFEAAQLVGWMALLVGYAILFLIEL